MIAVASFIGIPPHAAEVRALERTWQPPPCCAAEWHQEPATFQAHSWEEMRKRSVAQRPD